MADNSYYYGDYTVRDKQESQLKAKLSSVVQNTLDSVSIRKDLNDLMTKNRAIDWDSRGIPYVKSLPFSKYILDRMKLIKVSDTFYIYNIKEHRYEPISDDIILSFCMKIMAEYDETFYPLVDEKEVMVLISRQVKNMKELKETSGYIVLKNGTYNIKNHKFKATFNRKIINLTSVDFNYDPNAECPKFIAFLNDIFDGNESLIMLMQQIFGYTFCYGNVKMHKLFYFYGNGRNGKGVLANILTDLHGDMNVSAVFLDDLARNFSASNLVGKVLNISPEGKQSVILDTSMIKSLTAGDKVMVEQKYKDAYPTRLSTKFIVLSNFSLRTDDDSFGFQQRIVPIPFRKIYHELSYDGERQEGVNYQDPDLYKKLKKELPGIFNWAMEGLIDLKLHNWTLIECKEVTELRNQFTLKNKPVRLFFKSCFELAEENDCIKSSEVTQAFRCWSRKNNISIAGFERAAEFHQEFRNVLSQENLMSTTKKRKGYEHYYGVRLKDNYEGIVNY